MNCVECLKDTINPRFCSRSCAAKTNNRGKQKNPPIDRSCKVCSKIYKYKRNYNTRFLCDTCILTNTTRRNLIENMTLSEIYSKRSVSKKHRSWRAANIRGLNRSWNRDLVKLPCASCGYSKHVELAHRIPISSFSDNTKIGIVNHKSNVIQLCPNCHWEFDHGLLNI